MKYKDLNSSNIIDIMLEEIPELKKTFEAYKEQDNLSLIHNVFAFVFNPFLKDSLISKNEKRLKNTFNFLERIASSSDHEIKNILSVTIIESLSPKQLNIFLLYAGPRTKRVYEELEKHLQSIFKR